MPHPLAGFHPLAGVRVIDFSHVIAGPLASFCLSQLGAEVLKIEAPGGDVMRRTEKGAQAFVALNAGKSFRQVDLADATQRDAVIAEALTCDVLIDNLRPGVLAKFGLDARSLQAKQPRLIHCTISGFGTVGPWAGRPAYDHVVQAQTGMTLLAGNPDDPPVKVGFPVVDAGTGLVAAMAILAGLRERDRTGKGAALDVPMNGAAMMLMYSFACDALTHGATPQRVGNQGYSGSPAADLFRTADGWIAIGANTPRHVRALLRELGINEGIDGLGDANAPATFARVADPAALKRLLATAIAGQDGTVLEAKLAAAGVPVSRVNTLGEFAAKSAGALPVTDLRDGDTAVRSPGLGFRVL